MNSVTVPGKIFLFGEYSILEGGTAVLAAIKPQHTYFTGSEAVHTPHPESPLGRWLAEFSKDVDLKRVPAPWSGAIPVAHLQGLGSSTAELIAAWQLQKIPASPRGLLAWYRSQFPKQSGADLTVQLQASGDGLGVYEVKPDATTEGEFQIVRLPVGRVAKQLLVLKAPESKKIPTHENLKHHSKVGFDAFKLEFYHEKLKRLLATDESHRDWKILTDWASELASYGLESDYGKTVRTALTEIKGVHGAKGCGAGLNDLFLLAVSPDFDREALDRVSAEQGLRWMGSLHDLLDSGDVVRAFAPVNIAWIKYMGKKEGGPTNPSVSITLDHVGTLTEIELRVGQGTGTNRFYVHWNELGYTPPEAGREKIEAWLRDERVWDPLFEKAGYPFKMPTGEVWITTFNSAPAATGIATSASGFAALALAWSACLLTPEDRQKWIHQFESATPEGERLRALVAQAASRGSGSAGRSVSGPWVEWTADRDFSVRKYDTDWVDCILLLDHEPKKVSSSQAHERVKTSPLFVERLEKLPARILAWREAMEKRDTKTLRTITLEEALEMHQLFHTSQPGFTYLNDASKRWIDLARFDSGMPSREFVVTLDAGSNVHWFVRPKELKLWRTWFKFKEPQLQWIEGKVGKGAQYA